MSKRVYTEEHYKFLKEICIGKSIKEIHKLFNERFNMNVTLVGINSYMYHHNLSSGRSRSEIMQDVYKNKPKLFDEEKEKFIRENCIGISSKELLWIFNNHFGVNYKLGQIRRFMDGKKITTGFNGRFKKGQVPLNKGKKINYEMSEAMKATQFKKGSKPANYKSVGFERLNIYGYIEVKVAEPNKWRLKHCILWEEYHNKKIPKGYIVMFGDGNKDNYDINNLLLVSRAQLCKINQFKLLKNEIELTKSGILIADIHLKLGECKQKNKAFRKQKSGEKSGEA